MTDNWKRQLNITKNNAYDFPPYIPKFHCFPYHSSPTILPHLSPITNILQSKHYLSISHHYLPLLHHSSLNKQYPPHHYLPLHHHQSFHQQPPPLISKIFSLNCIY